jgi:exodeoxyribonuclease VII large subunit
MTEQIKPKDEKIFSVSEYLKVLNVGLKNYRAKIIGEVNEANFGPTGHVYFSLKDKKDGSIIKCVIWNKKYELYGVEIKEGVEIISSGCPSIHSQYGFKFIAETIQYAGEGELKKEYERLKKKLTQEGIFAKERKRPIPKYAQKIGLITSRKGAAITDFSSNLGKFGFKVKMVDSRVEGQAAVTELLSSIKALKKCDIEALVITRGGGSLESLMAFNNEALVREVADFPVPVIAAIGHEKDVPLMSLAADLMVSTPTAAANALSKPWEQALVEFRKYERDIVNLYNSCLLEARQTINTFYYNLKEGFGSILLKYREAENSLKGLLALISKQLVFEKRNMANMITSIFKRFVSQIKDLRQNVEDIDFYYIFHNCLVAKKKNVINYSEYLLRRFSSDIRESDKHILNIENILRSNNPERQLNLGYSIIRREGILVKSVKGLKVEDQIDIQVSDGTIKSKVKNINNK